jgi:hypothetical protein
VSFQSSVPAAAEFQGLRLFWYYENKIEYIEEAMVWLSGNYLA